MKNVSCKCESTGKSLLLLAGVVLLAGCGPKSYKRDADEQVYKFVDKHWEPEFGPQANYRIHGAPAGPDDIGVEQVARVEKVVADTGILTVPQAAMIALACNRDYQLAKELLYTTTLDMRLIRHAYEMQFFGGGTALYSNDGLNERVVVEPNLGFNRLLATGAAVGTTIGARWADIMIGSGRHGWSGVLGASVVQPLLRGSNPRVVREPLTQAERNALYQIRTVCRSRKLWVVAALTQYYETLELLDVAKTEEARIAYLVTLEGRVGKMVEGGRLPQEELDQVRQETLRARDSHILAAKEYDRFLDFLKITLGVSPALEFDLDYEVFESLKANGIPYPDFSLDEAIEAALIRRLDLTNNADMVIDAQRAVYVAADGLRTAVNVFANTNLRTDGDKSTTAGVTVDLPLDRVAEQNVYAKALVMLNQREREYGLTADTVRHEVRDAHRKLLESAERYRVLSEGVRLAQDRVDNTFELLRYGRVSSRRVLTALEHWRDARNDMADALTDYAIATLNFYRDTEVLQVRPDGMWEVGPGAMPVARTGVSGEKAASVR
ncbi:MAG TPA: TolC family protein [Sedimentisphaerales bacterium]|jgi:outer membrane protein TolC|nr:TolC family protein [Sedimentisphaerales bacterium]HNU31642.1 TolC family protein [Sedimentisphaerales bacterium]